MRDYEAEFYNAMEEQTHRMLAGAVNEYGMDDREFRVSFVRYMNDGEVRPYITVYDTKGGLGNYKPVGEVWGAVDGDFVIRNFKRRGGAYV
jgi:hypothetical protein